MEEEIISKVWLIHDPLALTGNEVGILKLSGGVVSFTTQEGEHFNVPLDEVKHVNWPFYEMGLSFTGIFNEKKYRFIFGDPTRSNTAITLAEEISTAVDSFTDIVSGRDEAKKWKAALKGQ